jgi:hypothetical protein
MDFNSLRKLMPKRFDGVVDELLAIKANVDESFMIERHSDLNAYIDESIRDCEARVPAVSCKGEDAEINKLFKNSIA